MERALLLALICCLAGPAAAQTDLSCPEMKPKARTIKVSRMEPLRRGKLWLPGTPRNAFSAVCDLYGMKTEESEYDGKTLVRLTTFEYKEKEDSAALCEAIKSAPKPEAASGDEARQSAADFCRANRKKDYRAVLVYDASPSQGKDTERKPVRRIFRLLDARGRVTEERSFDTDLALESVTLNTYAKGGALTDTATSDFDGRPLKRVTYTRDPVTNSLTETYFGESNVLRSKAVREYRDDGTLRRQVTTAYDSAEQPVTRTEIYCDVNGHFVNELVYDVDSAEPKYAYDYYYVYDKKGNWTEERKTRVTMFNGNRLEDPQATPDITLRETVYY